MRDEFDRILRFWFDRGVAGFRIDVAHGLVKDRLLRDDPAATDDDSPSVADAASAPSSINRPEASLTSTVAGVGWQTVPTTPHASSSVRRTFSTRHDGLVLRRGDELDLAYNLASCTRRSTRPSCAGSWRRPRRGSGPRLAGLGAVHARRGALPDPVVRGRRQKVRCALLALLTLAARRSLLRRRGRHASGRRPLVGGTRPRGASGSAPNAHAVVTRTGRRLQSPAATPWLPFGDSCTHGPGSARRSRVDASFCRRLLGVRRERCRPAGASSYESAARSPRGWAWRRGSAFATAPQPRRRRRRRRRLSATILAATRPERDGEATPRPTPCAAVGRNAARPRLLTSKPLRSLPGRALRRRNGSPGRNLRRLLEPGRTAAPGRESLALLPSGSDAVRTLPVRGTWLSTLRAPAQAPKEPAPRAAFGPARADVGFREPLAPRLARPGASMVPRHQTPRLLRRGVQAIGQAERPVSSGEHDRIPIVVNRGS